MLLSYIDLKKLVLNGVITNVTDDMINGTSIDVTLGNQVLIEQNPWVIGTRKSSISIGESLNAVRKEFKEYFLAPSEFILAQSEQVFHMPLGISAQFLTKSSTGRIGLGHMFAGWCDPGWNGSVLTLELKNMTRHHTIVLRPGDRIGQVVFYRHDVVPEQHSYRRRGRYNNDAQVEGAKCRNT